MYSSVEFTREIVRCGRQMQTTTNHQHTIEEKQQIVAKTRLSSRDFYFCVSLTLSLGYFLFTILGDSQLSDCLFSKFK